MTAAASSQARPQAGGADVRHVVCVHCRTTNRVPAARLAEDPVCGKCGQPLLDGRPVTLGDGDFDAVAGRSDLPVVIDFWAEWCGPCRIMAPQFEQAARQCKGRTLFVKVDSDASPRLAQRFAVRSIPTLVRLEQGREVARRSGALPASAIVAFAS